MLLVPQQVFQDVTHITPDYLARHGICGLVLDVDNTLALHDDPALRPDIAAWLDSMRAAGIRLTIASNNHDERVRPFAKAIGLDYVADAAKPLSKGLETARQRWGLEKAQMAVVGDQLFTDRLAAGFYGCAGLVVLPLGPETKWYIKAKRVLEKPFFRSYAKRGGSVL